MAVIRHVTGPGPVGVVDEAGLIVFANPAAVTALGYGDAAELYRKPSHATVHYKRPDGSQYPQDDCPMLTPRQTGETVHGDDEWFVRRDGSMFPIAWWSAPIAMAEGNGAVELGRRARAGGPGRGDTVRVGRVRSSRRSSPGTCLADQLSG